MGRPIGGPCSWGTMIKLTAFAILAWAACAGAAEAATNCWVPYIRTLADQTVVGTMTVKIGKRCVIQMRSSAGPTFGLAIVARPSHGGLRIAGHSVVYQPSPGYIGPDTFTYTRVGLDTRNKPIKRTVRIDVTVSP